MEDLLQKQTYFSSEQCGHIFLYLARNPDLCELEYEGRVGRGASCQSSEGIEEAGHFLKGSGQRDVAELDPSLSDY